VIVRSRQGTERTVMSASNQKQSVAEILGDALALIVSQADNHKKSVAYNDGENIALVNIRNIGMIALDEVAGRSDMSDITRLRHENMTLKESVTQLAEALRLYGNAKSLSFARGDLQGVVDLAMAKEI
jgi:hypothetical protein